MKYRKLPVEIEAVQWTGENIVELTDFCKGAVLEFEEDDNGVMQLFIPTLEGKMKASISDFVIRGVSGEYYPCKSEIFWKTYEKV